MAALRSFYSTPDKALAHCRLLIQGLILPRYETPLEVARAYGVMQGQDLGVISSAALRTTSGDVSAVIDSMNRHELVRGYPMRGTVFMGAAEDMRWITELCSEGISAQGRKRSEKAYGLTSEMFDRLTLELMKLGDEGITRAEYKELVANTLPELCDSATGKPDQGIVYRSLFQLLIEHVVVYSGWDGKDQLIFLADNILGPGLDERFDSNRVRATADLLTRYVSTHGFVTVADFAWWSKLPKGLIKEALSHVPDNIVATDRGHAFSMWGAVYDHHSAQDVSIPRIASEAGRTNLVDLDYLKDLEQHYISDERFLPRVVKKELLLPAFDEFILGYKDRMFSMTTAVHEQLVPGNRGVFKKPVVIDGTVRGAWNRKGTVGKRKIDIEVYSSVPKVAYPKLEKAFGAFPFLSD